MARPKKQPEERRTSRFNLRFTAAEDAYVREQAFAADLSPTDYLRALALDAFGEDRFSVPLSPDERAKIPALADAVGLTTIEFARHRLLGYRISHTALAAPRLLADINRLGMELRAIGNNVNQVARAMNTERTHNVDPEAVFSRLQELADEVAQALQVVTGR